MKTPITITAIIALHVALIGMIFVQPGCSSTTNEPSDTAPEVVVPATPDEPEPYRAPEGSAALRENPTRPAFSIDDRQQGAVLTPSQSAPVQPAVVKPRETTPAPVASNDTIAPMTPSVAATSAATPVATQTPTPVENSIETEVYIVKKGDTLSKIASKNKMTVAQIKSVNNLKSDSIRIGQKLILNKSANPTVASSASTTKAPAASANKKVDPNAITYTVKSGDTLGAISKKYGVSVDTLMKNNSMTDARKLRVGQVLYIKSNETASATTTIATPVVAPESKTPAAPAQEPKKTEPTIQPDTKPATPESNTNPEIIEI